MTKRWKRWIRRQLRRRGLVCLFKGHKRESKGVWNPPEEWDECTRCSKQWEPK